jgi:uncharacterized protein
MLGPGVRQHGILVKLDREQGSGHRISGIGDGEICIGEQRLTAPCIVAADRLIIDWRPPPPAQLALLDLEPLLALQPELVVIGTGAGQRFLDPHVATAVLQRGIGLEVMATPAACRTYNILVAEGRRVVAALYPP